MPILDEQSSEFVRSSYPFNLLDEESYTLLAPEFRETHYSPGTTLYLFDEPANFFYLILSGSVEISSEKTRKNEHPTLFGAGSCFGEEALKENGFRLTDAICREHTRLISINREALLKSSEETPGLRKSYSLLYLTLKHRLRLNTPWLGDEETVRLISRRHPFFFFSRIILINLVSVALSSLLISNVFSYRGFSIWLFLLAIIIFFLGLLLSAWAALEWTNDYLIITTERVLVQKKLIGFFESRQEVPLSAILSTGMGTSLFGRIVGYGSVNLRSYNGNLRFIKLPAPRFILSLLDVERYRVEEETEENDQASMREMLARRLIDQSPQQTLKSINHPAMLPLSMYESGSILDIIAKFVGLRQVKNGSVIYRTHWWILLNKTIAPAMILVAVFIFVLAKVSGSMPGFPENLAFILAIAVTIFSFGWWLYQYLDWHNDIYVISADQLLDVNRKPLGSEERRSAPIKNIQTVEFLRKGIIGLVLNFGTVRVQIGNEELTFDNVYDPAAIQTEIFAQFKNFNETVKRKEHAKLAGYIQIYDEIRGQKNPGSAGDKRNESG